MLIQTILLKSGIFKSFMLLFLVLFQLSFILVVHPKANSMTLSGPVETLSNTNNSNMPQTNGDVKVVEEGPGNSVYLGGDFSLIGKSIGGYGSFNQSTGTKQSSSYDSLLGGTQLMIPNTSGGYFVYGRSLVSGSQAFRSYDASGNLLWENTSLFWSGINDMEYYNGLLYVCGRTFTGTSGYYSISTLNASTGVFDRGIVTIYSGSGCVDMEVESDYIVYHTDCNTSLTSCRVDKYDRTNPSVLVPLGAVTVSGKFSAIKLNAAKDTLYIGGNFTSITDNSSNNFARTDLLSVNANTMTATSWAPTTNGSVRSITVDGSTIYVGGDFTTVQGGTSRNRAAAFTTAGSLTSWDPSVTGELGYWGSLYVSKIEIIGVSAYLFGVFDTVGSQSRFNFASVNLSDGALNSIALDFDGHVSTINLSDQNLLIGGDFQLYNVVRRDYIAQIDVTTGAVMDFKVPNPNADVYSLYYDSDTNLLYAGGYFDIYDFSRNAFAAFDSNTGAVDDLDLLIDGGYIESIVPRPNSDTILIGGGYLGSRWANQEWDS